ncbi:4-(cytidine 5'-diphospho)-2-C-methyl-D-erythritol kinase [Chromobacterium subtsugae]|uniref:4-diphosphocytidyl-2-C-methyl-D-erythritol kinase n=1 Tax=Chromobacterium subtsugae TaxID=251747 RepID=A0ABS7FFP3_9NEIS|nr:MULTISPECIES: 4-(cytidine 5'-diphospho)-2-C-methyl-D-erythritol kinase [Chromobacterium]KUM03958.1 4-diphosphocytidyl-2C-methyl-D-erythritol kinase [Chromobacterium subtsugae]KZE86419.1 4-diphosphocytidyl-2C-methyl-D-erythritol kinase [Chromobacterium sp. F49]MBW7567678.1 4-(cytidine 5'-diphospho)-2-C-methyl-D-erythritol kinase [Chromobacterium subtsugae]MBW8288904.1 4-(cytidine 5'-diphospho)-2-C-methyl-D-erythritol kinase [Chromobacterium subtsugae]OBU85706.1 4-diphosphocytidyl-2C-methyl-D
MSFQFQSFPAPAKLNLLLHVVGKRADGYHLLETVFRFIDFGDTLEIAARGDGMIELLTPTDGVPAEQDLTVRAARLLQRESGCALGASIRLDKRIPMGGGLGGGSSDAATVLIALNRLWGLGWPRERLQALSLQLGADVPVFIFGRSALATGVGEVLAPIALQPAWYLVIHPQVHVPTAAIFRNFSQSMLTEVGVDGIMRILETTQQRRNDLQNVVSGMFPAVNEVLSELRKYGSPLMTGSGACVFMEFKSKDEADKVYRVLSEKYQGFVAQGLDVHPLFDSAE